MNPQNLSKAVEAVRGELRRTNFAGRTVTLAEGAAVVGATSLLALRTRRSREAIVLAAVGALGLADDILEPRQRARGHQIAKGLRGHLTALSRGRVTTGAAKALGIPAICLASALAARGPRPEAAIDAALAAGCANLVNLLDLRPGRALKVVIPTSAVLAATAEVGSTPRALAESGLWPALAAFLPDLREHGMLGDAGANVLGAAIGMAAAHALPRSARLGLLTVVVALTVASERVSFSAVIDRTPVLRAMDRLGRRPGGEAV